MNLAKYLISHGHEVRVLLHQANEHKITEMYEYEGVSVFPPGSNEHLVRWSNIIITHLEYAHWTIHIGKIFHKPVIFISHNTSFEAYDTVKDNTWVGVIYNCNAMRDRSPFTNPSVVLHPAIDRAKVVQPTGDYITMINCNENKGGKILCRVAAAMPERKFLAVQGSYDEQYIPNLPNVTIIENGPDIATVYRQTRILLMPSRYESWGMTATEAMACGIPVISTATFGLKENCGDAGMFIPDRGPLIQEGNYVTGDDGDSYDIKPIISHIKKLENKKTYEKQRELCLKRAAELAPEKELGECEQFLFQLVDSQGQFEG